MDEFEGIKTELINCIDYILKNHIFTKFIKELYETYDEYYDIILTIIYDYVNKKNINIKDTINFNIEYQSFTEDTIEKTREKINQIKLHEIENNEKEIHHSFEILKMFELSKTEVKFMYYLLNNKL
tara:strand:+ start:1973 stop:2350 length:378 start_codon:yes stop_codon:yes gene_type:complete